MTFTYAGGTQQNGLGGRLVIVEYGTYVSLGVEEEEEKRRNRISGYYKSSKSHVRVYRNSDDDDDDDNKTCVGFLSLSFP